MFGLFARGRRRVDLLQADRGSVVRDPPLFVVAGGRCRRRWSGTARPGCTSATAGRREAFAAFCGALRVGWHFCDAARSAGQGRRRAPAGFRRPQLRAGPRVRERTRLSSCSSMPGSMSGRIRGCTRRCDVGRSTGSSRSAPVRAPLPATPPDTDHRWVLRVPPDPYLRLTRATTRWDPRLVGRRVEARVTDREVLAGCSGQRRARLPPRRRARSARHRTITALEHAGPAFPNRSERGVKLNRRKGVRFRPALTRGESSTRSSLRDQPPHGLRSTIDPHPQPVLIAATSWLPRWTCSLRRYVRPSPVCGRTWTVRRGFDPGSSGRLGRAAPRFTAGERQSRTTTYCASVRTGSLGTEGPFQRLKSARNRCITDFLGRSATT